MMKPPSLPPSLPPLAHAHINCFVASYGIIIVVIIIGYPGTEGMCCVLDTHSACDIECFVEKVLAMYTYDIVCVENRISVHAYE